MILFLDFAGAPYDGNTPTTKAIGGSEMAQIQLAEALAARGADVKILVGRDENHEPRTINGVTYGHSDLSKVKTVILSRMTPLPKPLEGRRIIVSLTDMGPHTIATPDVLVGVSRWQLDRFSGFKVKARKVIPPIVEPPPNLEKIPNRYIYASARAKGLDSTLAAWVKLRPSLHRDAELVVTTAGWDLPLEGSVEKHGARWLGVKTPVEIREEIAKASHLFYVNDYPETFCAVAVLAEIAKTTPLILCHPQVALKSSGMGTTGDGSVSLTDGRAGIKEAIVSKVFTDWDEWAAAVKNPPHCPTAKNYSARKIAQAWEKIL
jgi:hypothetical protein